MVVFIVIRNGRSALIGFYHYVYIYMYLYMYIYVCIYYMYDLRESARLYCLRVTNECRANNAYLSGENRGWKYNRKSAHPRSPDELTVPQ